MENRYDVLIVGAGITGLMAARRLAAGGKSVKVVDKGRGVGGRLATRRIGEGRADHGAQFFTVRSPEVMELVQGWLVEGLVFEWSRGWSAGSLADGSADGYPRYAVKGGFNDLAKHLATGLDVQPLTTIVSISADRQDGWQATDGDGIRYTTREVILTAPVPQSLALLDRGEVELASVDREQLEQIEYAPCLCGLFQVEGEVDLPAPGALQRPGHPVSWIADNQRKGISPEARIITVHAGPEASRDRWHVGDTHSLRWLQEELQPYLATGSKVVEGQLKRWRYALPVELHPNHFYAAGTRAPLWFAGDAFGGPRVEGAILSGIAVAAAAIGGR